MINQMNEKELPTLVQLVQQLKEENQVLVDKYDGWWNYPDLQNVPRTTCWNDRMIDFCNNADEDKYIAVKTKKGRITLKPNLRRHHFIYRGQSKQYRFVISSFTRDDYKKDMKEISEQEALDRHIVANLKCDEFKRLLRTHPLFVLLDRGIRLEHDNNVLFVDMNYYGLAQHYGFKSTLVDFSTDIDTAAFFACMENKEHDIYEPIEDAAGCGVIYVCQIEPRTTFKVTGFSTIGMQLYPRSGAQKGVLFNEPIAPEPLYKLYKVYPFRHDKSSSHYFYEMMEGGKKLFPPDQISLHAQEILDGNEISGATFAENIYSNQDDFKKNMESVERKGISINWHKQVQFTPEMLHTLYEDIKNGLWEEFCKNIYFADTNYGRELHEDLLKLPSNPNYAHYFKEEEYTRIFYYESSLYKMAVKNAKKRPVDEIINNQM